MHVPLAHHQHELLFRELGVDQRQRDAVKREVPRRVPRILPLVRHRDDVGVVQVLPFVIAAADGAQAEAAGPGSPSSHSRDHVVIELLRPQHSRERLPHHIRARRRDRSPGSRRRRIRPPRGSARAKICVELCAERRRRLAVESVSRTRMVDASARPIRRACSAPPPSSRLRRIHCVRTAVHDVLVDTVLHVTRRVRRTPNSRRMFVSFSVNSSSGVPSNTQPALAIVRLVQLDHCAVALAALQPGLRLAASPRPCVTKPHRRQHMHRRGFGPAVRDGDPDQDVLDVAFAYSTNTSK